MIMTIVRKNIPISLPHFALLSEKPVEDHRISKKFTIGEECFTREIHPVPDAPSENPKMKASIARRQKKEVLPLSLSSLAPFTRSSIKKVMY